MLTIRKGLLVGLITGLLFCVWITMAYRADGGAGFARRGLSYPSMIAMYLLVSTLTGTIIGALGRHADSVPGTYGIGFVASVPVVAGILVQQAGPPARWGPEQITLGPVLWVVGTIVIGSEIRRRRKSGDEAS
ncbi:MAG: hypothetical protein JWN79_92 [Gemmatimonadetes bacterium]|jgi:hypothetical protein|nr:hypothetical protein [Gemmatimonadota bacterium]